MEKPSVIFRYEFGEPDARGNRLVRAYQGDVCVLDGVLEPRRVIVRPACIHSYACYNSRGGEQVPDEYEARMNLAERARQELLATLAELAPLPVAGKERP